LFQKLLPHCVHISSAEPSSFLYCAEVIMNLHLWLSSQHWGQLESGIAH